MQGVSVTVHPALRPIISDRGICLPPLEAPESFLSVPSEFPVWPGQLGHRQQPVRGLPHQLVLLSWFQTCKKQMFPPWN